MCLIGADIDPPALSIVQSGYDAVLAIQRYRSLGDSSIVWREREGQNEQKYPPQPLRYVCHAARLLLPISLFPIGPGRAGVAARPHPRPVKWSIELFTPRKR